jgi:UDP-N-acetylmuramoyl-L-alanyl-D-glutamate--2,6-diaminopimelate ligase
MLNKLLRQTKKIIPKKVFKILQPAYHYTLAILSALIYRFPSKKIFIIAITGTKGKTSTVEIINAILEESGYKTAISSTLRFKVGKISEDNTYKMTLPGRFFLQKFLRRAVNAKCQYAIIEITSEAAKQFRHKFVYLDALVFTNISPEHIESHGSFENYLNAKLKIAKALEKSPKKERFIIANKDDKFGDNFLNIDVSEKHGYSIRDVEPYTLKKEGLEFELDGNKIISKLSGKFNLYNILSAVVFAKTQNINTETIKRAIEKFGGIAGRMEKIDIGQDFNVIVDYAHTADSLEKVYEIFQTSRKICVLGSTGGGRDKWKRPDMGSVASRHCSQIILTDEDPYDEDPEEIVNDIKKGITRQIVEIIMDRREAIKKALSLAKTGDTVIITGKGTDPYIMGANGKKTPWSDSNITREELEKIK